jgi:aminoglycoside phosphotransferase (APT) family kinase protein
MQYTLGCETAVCLKSIHKVTRTAAGRSWSNRIGQQIATLQQQCPRQIKRIACVQHMLRFLTEQAFRVEDRPITWLHGDLHADNLVLSYEDSVYLIDFEKSCLGDPVSDLCPLLVDLSPHSVPFVSALIDCYFCNRVDSRLLTLVAFYSALDVLSRLVRDVSADAPAQQESLARAARLTRDYAGFKSMVPVWFKPLPALPGRYME